MTATHKNRVQMTVTSVASAGLGTITLNAASSGYQTFASAYAANATVDILITEGATWEVASNCAYTNSGTTVTRGTLEASSTGSAVAFTSAAVVSVILSAARGNSLESALQSVVPGGRLTLESGVPVSTAANLVAVSGQDTTADTITVTAHGWSVGTMVKSSATSGGLTAGTQYYAGSITTNTISVHTTVAGALAGTGKVDITGAVTASITASGVANTSIYYTSYVHHIINLWDGLNWVPTTFTEKTLALGTLTDAKPYDVFGYLSAGELVLESLVWTSDTARATAVTLQDGRYCKSGDKTRLLLGTFYTTSTTTTENSLGKRYLWNAYNRQPSPSKSAVGDSHTYATATLRDWNNGSGVTPRVQFVTGLVQILACIPQAFATKQAAGSVALNSTIRAYLDGVDISLTDIQFFFSVAAASGSPAGGSMLVGSAVSALSAGRHYVDIYEAEYSGAAVTYEKGLVTIPGWLA